MGAPSSSGGQSNAHAPVVVSPADLQDETPPPAGRREDRGCRQVSTPAHGTFTRTRFVRSTAALRARAPPLWEGEPMRRSIVNDPENLVPEALEGLVLSNPLQLELHEQHRFVTRRERARNKVGLVSGGGSGHEPLHA